MALSLTEGLFASLGAGWQSVPIAPKTGMLCLPLLNYPMTVTVAENEDKVLLAPVVFAPFANTIGGMFTYARYCYQVCLPDQTTTGTGTVSLLIQYRPFVGGSWTDLPGDGVTSPGITLGMSATLAPQQINTVAMPTDMKELASPVQFRLVARTAAGSAGTFQIDRALLFFV